MSHIVPTRQLNAHSPLLPHERWLEAPLEVTYVATFVGADTVTKVGPATSVVGVTVAGPLFSTVPAPMYDSPRALRPPSAFKRSTMVVNHMRQILPRFRGLTIERAVLRSLRENEWKQ